MSSFICSFGVVVLDIVEYLLCLGRSFFVWRTFLDLVLTPITPFSPNFPLYPESQLFTPNSPF